MDMLSMVAAAASAAAYLGAEKAGAGFYPSLAIGIVAGPVALAAALVLKAWGE